MGLFNWFKNDSRQTRLDLGYQTEFHNHLIPAIDDGSESIDESVALVETLHSFGITRIITTPHVMSDFYKNTPEQIYSGCNQVVEALHQKQIPVAFEAAAEYYLDEGFITKVESNEPLLSFGDGYVLFETSYINESPFLTKVIFDLRSHGYKPILAHPERYTYFGLNMKKYEAIYELGIYFQLNSNSLSGYYSPEAKKIAEKLIDAQMVNFIGTDTHSAKHLHILRNTIRLPYYEKLLQLDILNDKIPLTLHRK